MGLFSFGRNKKSRDAKAASGAIPNISINATSSSSPVTNLDVIPASQQIKVLKPSPNGLYPHEILLLSYAPSFKTSGNKYQGFWWYRYGVKDLDKLLESLEKRGFICVGDVFDSLQNEKAAVLKEILKAHGLSTTGKKEALLSRIKEEIPADELIGICPDRYFALTEVGKNEVAENAYVLYIHRHDRYDLDIYSLARLIGSKPVNEYLSVIHEFLSQQCEGYLSKGQYQSYRSSCNTYASFLIEQGQFEDALDKLAVSAYYVLNDARNDFYPDLLLNYAKYYFPYDNSQIALWPGIFNDIKTCQNELRYSDSELESVLIENMKSARELPIKIFPIEECAHIVVLEIAEEKDALVEVYKKAEQRFIKAYGKPKALI